MRLSKKARELLWLVSVSQIQGIDSEDHPAEATLMATLECRGLVKKYTEQGTSGQQYLPTLKGWHILFGGTYRKPAHRRPQRKVDRRPPRSKSARYPGFNTYKPENIRITIGEVPVHGFQVDDTL